MNNNNHIDYLKSLIKRKVSIDNEDYFIDKATYNEKMGEDILVLKRKFDPFITIQDLGISNIEEYQVPTFLFKDILQYMEDHLGQDIKYATVDRNGRIYEHVIKIIGLSLVTSEEIICEQEESRFNIRLSEIVKAISIQRDIEAYNSTSVDETQKKDSKPEDIQDIDLPFKINEEFDLTDVFSLIKSNSDNEGLVYTINKVEELLDKGIINTNNLKTFKDKLKRRE